MAVIKETLEETKREYARGEDRPLESYAVVMTTYLTAVAVAALALRKKRVPLPDGLPWKDLALASVATYKVSRLLAKGPVTSPLRAPFTEYEDRSGPAQLQEKVRGTGLRKAIGELLTCPFCLGQWVATGFVAGFVVVPRATRLATSVFSAFAVSDVLQLAYTKLEQSVEGK